MMSVFEVGIGFRYSFSIFKVGSVFGINISKYCDIDIAVYVFGIFTPLHYFVLLDPRSEGKARYGV